MLTLGGGGVTSIVMGWGAALQAGHAASRELAKTDLVTTKIGYWTDNQAFYDWYHWFPNVSSAGHPQDVLMALDAEMESKNLSMVQHIRDVLARFVHFRLFVSYARAKKEGEKAVRDEQVSFS